MFAFVDLFIFLYDCDGKSPRNKAENVPDKSIDATRSNLVRKTVNIGLATKTRGNNMIKILSFPHITELLFIELDLPNMT
jgi:hypothetical protein